MAEGGDTDWTIARIIILDIICFKLVRQMLRSSIIGE